MSNIYIQEPPTSGKVILKTTLGEIDIELWSKEAPKAARNFIQLSMEGYYNGTIFHRVVKDFIAQGGDPLGTGEGGESIYGKPFKDEIHSRLRFVRRGLVAMANAGPNDNGSQFFFSLAPTQELQKKHTIFGKVAGDTIYNLVKFGDLTVDESDRPYDPPKINSVEVISNPFDGIEPRVTETLVQPTGAELDGQKNKRVKKDLKLLSFGTEAEEEEDELSASISIRKRKGMSIHDVVENDPTLSSAPAVASSNDTSSPNLEDRLSPLREKDGEANSAVALSVREKMKAGKEAKSQDSKHAKGVKEDRETCDEDTLSEEQARLNRREELKKEAKALQRELAASKKRKQKVNEDEDSIDSAEDGESSSKKSLPTALAEYEQEMVKYKEVKAIKKRVAVETHQASTLSMLQAFTSQLRSSAKPSGEGRDNSDKKKDDSEKEEMEEEEEIIGNSWMDEPLDMDEATKKKVFDANVKDVDRYEIIDPRNELSKRRRKESKKAMKEKKRKRKGDDLL